MCLYVGVDLRLKVTSRYVYEPWWIPFWSYLYDTSTFTTKSTSTNFSKYGHWSFNSLRQNKNITITSLFQYEPFYNVHFRPEQSSMQLHGIYSCWHKLVLFFQRHGSHLRHGQGRKTCDKKIAEKNKRKEKIVCTHVYNKLGRFFMITYHSIIDLIVRI